MGALNIDSRVYRKQVEDILRKYPLYKQALKFRLYPSIIMDYSVEQVDGGDQEYASSTEKYGIIRAEYSQLVDQIEKTLELLTNEERILVERTYFKEEPFTWELLGWSKGHYYRKRNAALEKIAISLNMRLLGDF